MTGRTIVTAAALASFMASALPLPASAGAFDPTPVSALDAYDGHARSRSLAAGVSLRIPLDGGVRHSVRETRLSFSLDRRSTGSGVAARPLYTESRPLMDLSFSLTQGPDSLALNGVRFTDMRALHAEGEEEEDGGVNWWWVGGGAAAALLVAGAIAVGTSDFKVLDEPDGEQ